MEKYNIVVINPISIVGDIIIRGIARGFEKLGHNVISFDVRKIDGEIVKKFKPDFVLGLGYAHLINENAEKIVSSLNIPILHYFIDDPNSHFAHSGDETLYKKLCKTDGIIFSWDSHYLESFHKKAYYLPVGIDTQLYANNNNDVSKAKIVFTGRPLTDKREEVVAHIVKKFPDYLHIYSYKAHFDKSVEEMSQKRLLNEEQLESYKKCYKGFLESEKELAAIYHNSDIILNITMEQGATSMNYRVLEVLGSGAFLLTDYVEDTAKYFEEDKEFVFYRNFDDLTAKINKYIDNADLRNQIAGNGQKKVVQNHTLDRRAAEIIDIITVNNLL
jgi:spore maturation protein CgeB